MLGKDMMPTNTADNLAGKLDGAVESRGLTRAKTSISGQLGQLRPSVKRLRSRLTPEHVDVLMFLNEKAQAENSCVLSAWASIVS